MSILQINGRTIESLGLKLADQGPVWSTGTTERGSQPVLGRIGSRASTLAASPGRTLNMTLPLPESPSTRRAALDKVLGHLDGLLVLEWSDTPGRVQYGQLERAEILARFQSVAWTLGHLSIDLQIRIDNPTWFDWSASSIVLAANTPAAVPLGTSPSSPLIQYNSTASGSITITYRGQTGTVLSSLVLSDPTLTSSEVLIVDCGTERIFVVDGATVTLANNLYSSGSFPVFDPGDGDFESATYPTVESNFGALMFFRRAWQ